MSGLWTSLVLERLRATCPTPRVIEHLFTSETSSSRPAVFVGARRVSASRQQLFGPGAYGQMVDVIFSVYIVVDRVSDGVASQPTADTLDAIVDEARQGLILWTPDPLKFAPLEYGGGEMDRSVQGVVCWREDFVSQQELRYP